ncbi:hypothetical protein AHAS_Ahas06G0001200 [Arachis hypogaea]
MLEKILILTFSLSSSQEFYYTVEFRTATAEGRTIEQKVLESNLVIEVMPCCLNIICDFCSHFGKFVEIQFDQRERILGAAIRTYLLERSCVCQLLDS